MSGWTECPLSEVADVIPGFAFKGEHFGERGVTVIKIKDITPPTISIDGAQKVDLANYSISKLEKYKLEKGDYVVAMTGATIGKVGRLLVEANVYINQRVAKIEAKSGVDRDFVYFSLIDSAFDVFVQNNIDSHSAQENISGTSIGRYPIILPPLPEQKSIAALLSSLDDKIDLLHRQNKTLEAMAETLFRQWFVVEAQEDWELVSLSNFIDCFNGVSYKSSELSPSKVAMVTLKSFDRDGGFRLDGFKEFTGRFKDQQVVRQGDLVVAHTDITQDAEVIGNPVLVVNDIRYESMVISMDLVKIKSKHEWLSNEFLYRMMRTRVFKEHCLGYSNGSTVLHLSKQAIPSFEFFMPPVEKIRRYTEITKELFSKKFINIEQTRSLEKLRDALLPKLMSGEVRVG